jgi:hypothetical protein
MLVTYYTFGGKGGFRIAVSGSRNTTWIASQKTNFKFVDVSGFGAGKFYDNEDEMKKCIAQSQADFDESMMGAGMKLGFTPTLKEVEVEVNGVKSLEVYEAKLCYVKKLIELPKIENVSS